VAEVARVEPGAGDAGGKGVTDTRGAAAGEAEGAAAGAVGRAGVLGIDAVAEGMIPPGGGRTSTDGSGDRAGATVVAAGIAVGRGVETHAASSAHPASRASTALRIIGHSSIGAGLT
jgi:hypothetical protein